MSWIAWLVVGIVAGLIARAIVPGEVGGGIVADLVVGVVGAFIGGFVMSLVGHPAQANGINLPSIAVAVVGAVVLLALMRVFSGRRTTV
ncbi:MAG: GlsB/YeaQ/YmgE family stress response membrane protein [Armatimonadota bacterium]|nr:GlsB/YeaQ/YmgE family stress response membrane protein [Armatimonadota bacterium]